MVYWEKYRNSLIDKVKKIKNATWSGDGRFDSMGHSAKYGAYTMFCNSISKIVHFDNIILTHWVALRPTLLFYFV